MHRVFETVRGRPAARAQRVDDCGAALDRSLGGRLRASRHEYLRASAGVDRLDFRQLLGLKRAQLEQRSRKFQTEFRQTLAERRNHLAHAEVTLRERSPVVILSRGYSITRDASGRIVRDAAQVALGDDISVRLARGELSARVKGRR